MEVYKLSTQLIYS